MFTKGNLGYQTTGTSVGIKNQEDISVMVMQRKKDYSMSVDESEALGYNTTLATLNLSVLESSRIQPNMGHQSKRKENLKDVLLG